MPIPILADLDIGPKTLTRTFSGIPVGGHRPLHRRKPVAGPDQPSPCKGPWPQVQRPHYRQTSRPRVDARSLTPGRHRLNVSVELPDGVSLIVSRPTVITITVARSS